ncbi:MAG: TIGR02186 family protein [Desulfobulbaceae bacterium]|nr:TIGR02186 family protein [Desulfobulbaceae bacterium]HIJ78626.1 hypothetical protein [Deltaproteobacteria bacterium]
MKKTIILLLSCTMLVLAGLTANAFAENDINLSLEPAVVQISAFYNGTTVKVTGQIPATAEAVVRVTGSGEELHLKKKGKVGGLLWMNTGDVSFENAPTVVMLYTPAAITDLEASPVSPFSFHALKEKVEILPATEDKDFLFGEFLKLKQKDGLYITHQDAVSYGPIENDTKTFTVEMTIPTMMKPGRYTVELAAAQNGHLIGIASKEMKIEMIGFPAELTKLAFGKPIFFGVMAVLIAIGAGLFTGILFKSKGGAH